MRRHRVALIHGGLYEPMDSVRFWAETGVVRALAERGVDAITPGRLAEPRSWHQDADHVAGQLEAEIVEPVPIVGGSNGCSTAARLTIEHPDLAQRVAFCWPVSVGLDRATERSLSERIASRAGDEATTALLDGETLRGVLDRELTAIAAPVAVMASEPENPVHRRATADALLSLSPGAAELPPMPEPPVTGFEPDRFADAIVRWLALEPG